MVPIIVISAQPLSPVVRYAGFPPLQKSSSAAVPFRRMARLDSAPAATHGASVRLDSGVSVAVEDVASGVDAVNAHIRHGDSAAAVVNEGDFSCSPLVFMCVSGLEPADHVHCSFG